MKPATLILLSLLLAPASALAQGDVFLQWDDCPPAGVGLKAFACNTNTGADVLVGSFTTTIPLPDVVAIESWIMLMFPDNTIPSWWTIGGCRPASALQLLTDYGGGPGTCINPWPAGSFGALLMDTWPGWPSRGRLRTVQAVQNESAFPIVAGEHYYAFKVQIGHAKSTGTGACAGCEQPAGLMLLEVHLAGLNGLSEQFLNPPFETRNDPTHYADWQCDGTPGTWDHGTLNDYTWGPGCTVPTRRSTWGSVKSLYR